MSEQGRGAGRGEGFECAIFPLNSVLFPGTRMPLRIFEPRYLDMVSDSMKGLRPFCIAGITQGEETGVAAEHHSLACMASVVDWDQQNDGILGIVVEGGDRVRISETRILPNQLRLGWAAPVEEGESPRLEGELSHFGDLLERLHRDFSIFAESPERQQLQDAAWVSYQLANTLPIDVLVKQRILEEDEPLTRLHRIGIWLSEQVA